VARLGDEELAAWAQENLAATAGWCSRGLDELAAQGEAQAAFVGAVRELHPDTRRPDVALVAAAWRALPRAVAREITVAFPAVVGPLNGIPFAARVRATSLLAAVELAGLEERARVEGRRGAGENRNALTRLGGRLRALFEPHAVRERRRNLSLMLPGFRYAVRDAHPRVRLLQASTLGRGRFVALDGEITGHTRSVAVLVPGTFTDGGSLANGLQRVAGIDGHEEAPATAVGIYWAGGDFPRELLENGDPEFAERMRGPLAAFDAALDLELREAGAGEARETYVGHSFGAAAIGSAEALDYGLTADAVVYVGAPGAGFGISSPVDTVNPDAARYALVAKGDLTPVAGHLLFARAMGAAPLEAMGVRRLSTGFLDHASRSARLHNHDDYLRPGSTSALNIRAVVLGKRVLPWLGGVDSDEELAAKIDKADVGW